MIIVWNIFCDQGYIYIYIKYELNRPCIREKNIQFMQNDAITFLVQIGMIANNAWIWHMETW